MWSASVLWQWCLDHGQTGSYKNGVAHLTRLTSSDSRAGEVKSGLSQLNQHATSAHGSTVVGLLIFWVSVGMATCKQCKTDFKCNRPHQVFCNRRCRKQFEKARYRAKFPEPVLSTGTTGAISELRARPLVLPSHRECRIAK